MAWSLPLLTYPQTGAGIPDISEDEVPNCFDHRAVIALEDWLRADSSKLLYLESPSNMRAVAMRIVLAAGGTNPPVPCASFFCLEHAFDDEKDESIRHESLLLGVVYSLICQILKDLPPLTKQILITNKN